MWACHNDREDDLVGLPARAALLYHPARGRSRSLNGLHDGLFRVDRIAHLFDHGKSVIWWR
jgi:hypothetical protein